MATQTLTPPKNESQLPNARPPRGGKFLTFHLADEEYGIEILKVREINGIVEITALPQMPHYMKGVINLRGKVIPVIDLRRKFGLEEIAHTEQTCIIVVNVGREIGIIVDTVSEVLDITADNVEPPPEMTSAVDTTLHPRHGQGRQRREDSAGHRPRPRQRGPDPPR